MKLIFGVIFGFILTLGIFGQQKVGTAADAFSGTSLDGKEINLETLRGNVVVLTFWSTRCAICHEEIPKLNKLTDKYSGKDVVFMGLTMENETKVSLYLRKKPFNFIIVPNSLGVLMKYANQDNQGNPNMGFPAYFIVDQTGTLTYKSEGWDKSKKIDDEINKLLKKSNEKKAAEK